MGRPPRSPQVRGCLPEQRPRATPGPAEPEHEIHEGIHGMNGPQFARRSKRGRVLGLLAIVIVAALGTVGAVVLPSVVAQAATGITLNGSGSGRTFDGVGAVSGGGGNSRLLIDYPEPQRGQILDYLFKPGYGAALQILKVEIGGDTNSTSGAEPSHAHTRSDLNCDRGYEWWIMEQAKARNPNIKLAALAWGAPGWVGNGTFLSSDLSSYLLSWLGCAKQHGLTIDYIVAGAEREAVERDHDHQRPQRAQRQRLQRREDRRRRGLDLQPGRPDGEQRVPAQRCRRGRRALLLRLPGRPVDLQLLDQRHQLGQVAVVQRERLAGLQRRRQATGPGHQPGVPRRQDDRLPELGPGGLDDSEQPVVDGRSGAGQPAVVGLLLGRQGRLGDRAHHPVHRPRLEVPGPVQRLHRRQPQQRQLRDAEVDQQLRLQHHHRNHGRDRRADAELHRHRRAVDRPGTRLGVEPQLQQRGRLPGSPVRHHPVERAVLAHRAAGLRLHHHHHHRAGQGHRDQPGTGLARACRTRTTSTASPPGTRPST